MADASRRTKVNPKGNHEGPKAVVSYRLGTRTLKIGSSYTADHRTGLGLTAWNSRKEVDGQPLVANLGYGIEAQLHHDGTLALKQVVSALGDELFLSDNDRQLLLQDAELDRTVLSFESDDGVIVKAVRKEGGWRAELTLTLAPGDGLVTTRKPLLSWGNMTIENHSTARRD